MSQKGHGIKQSHYLVSAALLIVMILIELKEYKRVERDNHDSGSKVSSRSGIIKDSFKHSYRF